MHFAAARRYPVHIRRGQFVIRLFNAGSQKINPRSIAAPYSLTFVIVPAGELLRLCFLLGSGGYGNDPDVLVPFGIQKSLVVVLVVGARDQVDIGFMLLAGSTFLGTAVFFWTSVDPGFAASFVCCF